MEEAVVNIAAFAINPELGITGFDSVLTPKNIIRAAERARLKVEPLLAEAALRLWTFSSPSRRLVWKSGGQA
jgi:hypothetical protein